MGATRTIRGLLWLALTVLVAVEAERVLPPVTITSRPIYVLDRKSPPKRESEALDVFKEALEESVADPEMRERILRFLNGLPKSNDSHVKSHKLLKMLDVKVEKHIAKKASNRGFFGNLWNGIVSAAGSILGINPKPNKSNCTAWCEAQARDQHCNDLEAYRYRQLRMGHKGLFRLWPRPPRCPVLPRVGCASAPRCSGRCRLMTVDSPSPRPCPSNPSSPSAKPAGQSTTTTTTSKKPSSVVVSSTSSKPSIVSSSRKPGNEKPDDSGKPGDKPDGKPGDKPGSGGKPEDKPSEKPGNGKPGEKPGDKPGEKPGNGKPGDKPGEKPGSGKPGDKPGEKPGNGKPGEKPGDKPGEKPGNGKPGDKPGAKPGAKPGNGKPEYDPGDKLSDGKPANGKPDDKLGDKHDENSGSGKTKGKPSKKPGRKPSRKPGGKLSDKSSNENPDNKKPGSGKPDSGKPPVSSTTTLKPDNDNGATPSALRLSSPKPGLVKQPTKPKPSKPSTGDSQDNSSSSSEDREANKMRVCFDASMHKIPCPAKTPASSKGTGERKCFKMKGGKMVEVACPVKSKQVVDDSGYTVSSTTTTTTSTYIGVKYFDEAMKDRVNNSVSKTFDDMLKALPLDKMSPEQVAEMNALLKYFNDKPPSGAAKKRGRDRLLALPVVNLGIKALLGHLITGKSAHDCKCDPDEACKRELMGQQQRRFGFLKRRCQGSCPNNQGCPFYQCVLPNYLRSAKMSNDTDAATKDVLLSGSEDEQTAEDGFDLSED